MTAAAAVSVDLKRGVVTLGATQVALAPADRLGWFRLPGGSLARMIGFIERTALVADALASEDPQGAVTERLREAALTGAHDPITDAVLLALAGGAEEAPSFAECLETVCRLHALDWQSAQGMLAVEVDQMAAGAGNERAAPGEGKDWIRFEFAPKPEAIDLAAICAEMTARLLARGLSLAEEIVRGEAERRIPVVRPRKNGVVSEKPLRASAVDSPVRASSGAAADAPLGGAAPGSSAAPSLNEFAHEAEWQTADAADGSRAEAMSARAFQKSRVRILPRSAVDNALRRAAAENELPTPEDTAVSFSSALPVPSAFSNSEQPLARSDWPDFNGNEHERAPNGLLPVRGNEAPRFESPDWVFEIAQALADECDLRGLDA